jgi:hypothetical protein
MTSVNPVALNSLLLVKSTVEPRKFAASTPNLFYDTTFINPVTFDLSYAVKDDAALIGEKVSTQSGMFLWLPNLGTTSMFHMGFVPIGTTTLADGAAYGALAVRGFGLTNGSWGNSWANGGAPTYPWLHRVYTGVCAIPYNNRIAPDSISSAPALKDQFSKTRMLSGIMECYSSTRAITTTALSGTFSCAAISDTRDLSEATDKTCYSVTNLDTQGVTARDGIKQIPVQDGVAVIIGPDMPPDFSAPEQNNTSRTNGEFSAVIPIASFATRIGPFFPYTSQPQSHKFFTAFITSKQENIWPEDAIVPTAEPPANHNLIKVTPIDETGTFDVVVAGRFGLQTNTPNQCIYKIEVTALHFFETCGSDGGVYTQQYAECQSTIITAREAFYNDGAGGDQPPVNTVPYNFTFSPKHLRRSYELDGAYAGVLIVCSSMLIVGDVAVGAGDALSQLLYEPTVSVTSTTVNLPGAVGPARVIRYDKVGAGQVIEVSGFCNVQCIPQGSLAPFVQAGATWTPEGTDLNIIPFIAQLFNGVTPLQRVWIRSAYLEFVAQNITNMTPESFAALIDIIGDAKHTRFGLAAGFFGSLANMAGNVLDGIAGTSGNFEGNRVGLNNAVNMPGGGGAAGQFRGGAAGQFRGGAAGQFDAVRRQRN